MIVCTEHSGTNPTLHTAVCDVLLLLLCYFKLINAS